MTDALDRASEAMYDAMPDDAEGYALAWSGLHEQTRAQWRPAAAAALRVMADDLRALHTYATGMDGEEEVTYCEHCGEIGYDATPDCPELEILDRYVGSADD